MTEADRVTLRLEAGLCYGRAICEPATDIPPGAVLAEAPLYPGAAATTEEQSFPLFDCPATPYLKSAAASFLLPATRDEAIDWYRQAMTACGYREGGHGQTSRHGEIQSMGIRFLSLNHPGLQVQLSFQSVSPSRTHLLYVATAVTLPPRPSDSYLPYDVQEIEVTYRFPFSGSSSTQEISHFTVKDESVVRELVGEINTLTEVAAGIGSGRLHRGESATLVFRTRGSVEIPVELRLGIAVTVGDSRTLKDRHMRVWAVVTRLAEEQRRQ